MRISDWSSDVCSSDLCRCRSGQVQRDAVAFRQVTGLGVAAIIDGIAFKAGIGEFADDLGKAEAHVLRGIEAGSGDSNPFCVHSPWSFFIRVHGSQLLRPL